MHRLSPILLALMIGCIDGSQSETPLSPEQAQIREVRTQCEEVRQLAQRQKDAALPKAASNNLLIPSRDRQILLAGDIAYQECIAEQRL